MTDYPFILTKQHPEAKWVLNGDDYSNINWLEGTDAIPKEQLDNEYQAYLEEKDKLRYIDERAAAYNERGADIQSVVEALRENLAESRPEKLQAIQAIVDQVKLEFPKPEVTSG